MPEIRYDVYGRRIAIVGGPGAWTAFQLGADGKRSPAGFVVPDFLAEDELGTYLADLFHESATPSNGDVARLS